MHKIPEISWDEFNDAMWKISWGSTDVPSSSVLTANQIAASAGIFPLTHQFSARLPEGEKINILHLWVLDRRSRCARQR